MNRNRGQIQIFFIEVALLFVFIGLFFKSLFSRRLDMSEIANQTYKAGYQSFFLISITAFILGLVLTIQTRPVLSELGAESWLPSMVFISVVREMGPVITALLFAGKVGSGIGAELSSMRVTEQIDAMEVSASNPMNFVVVTRVLATTIALPVLVFYTDLIALIGSYIGLNAHEGISFDLFFSQAIGPMTFMDVIPAVIKTVFFGFAVGIVSCYKGYYADKGTEGVGKAANSAVVVSSLVIFILDLITVQITDIL